MTNAARAARATEDAGGDTMLADVRVGLSRDQKELPPKYFYDRRGSELFERITRLPEYYPTRAERAALAAWAPELIASTAARTLVELGAGSATKTRLLLDPLTDASDAALYVPVDVSAAFLQATALRLRAAYPTLEVVPVVADLTAEIVLPPLRVRPVLFAFLGSTIGNLESPEAVRLLRRIRAIMRGGDAFLLGADLRKDVTQLEAAYNDAAGITAEFNRNVLRVLNRELGADFDLAAFAHRAFYDREHHRIEMHLVATRPQRVTIPRLGTVSIAAGESIRTEISCKYDRPSIEAMLGAAGLALTDWRTDPAGLFALALSERAP